MRGVARFRRRSSDLAMVSRGATRPGFIGEVHRGRGASVCGRESSTRTVGFGIGSRGTAWRSILVIYVVALTTALIALPAASSPATSMLFQAEENQPPVAEDDSDTAATAIAK